MFYHRGFQTSCALMLPILSFFYRAIAAANPSGGQVAAGQATLEGGTGALTIRQGSDRGIINWQSFSIGAGEVTKFLQPSGNSAILESRQGRGVFAVCSGRCRRMGRFFS